MEVRQMTAFSVIVMLIVFILLIYVRLNFANIKGSYGETQVKKILSKLNTETYKVFHDLYVPTEQNKTTQVDHIVISPYGIFVIETKHYNGWIFGSEKNRYWTQVIYKRKEKLFNPIWQNAGHIKALENYLGLDKYLFSNIIAFSNQSTFKFKEGFTRAKVIHFTKLLKTIQSEQYIRIDAGKLRVIQNKLNNLVISDKKVQKLVSTKHINRIKTERNKLKLIHMNKNKCPQCQSDLLKRNGKYGAFM